MTERDLHIQKKLKGRHLARTDLLWLARNILHMKKIVPHVHGPMTEFLQDFSSQGKDIVTLEQHLYTPVSQDPIENLGPHKRRLLLAPRGWYKTSLNIIAHSIQWILNYPDITILLVHSSQEMAEQMLVNIKMQFSNNPTMRYFFPEFCPAPRAREWGTQQQFNTPARRLFTPSPTMQVSGIETIRTGMHYHVLKFTDIIDEKNTATKELRDKIVYKFSMSRNLLIGPKYWIDVEGTRYHFGDLYGRVIKEWITEEKEEKPHTYRVFVMGCYKRELKNTKEKEEFTPDELSLPFLYDAKGQPISRFPEEFPVEELEAMRRDKIAGEDVFNTQQLNNPIDSENMVFPQKEMRWKSRADIERIIHSVGRGYIKTTVDLAETTGRKSDFSCITTCVVDRMNRRYILDIQIGRWKTDEIVSRIFAVHSIHKPTIIEIEETGFTRALKPTIYRMSEITGVWPNFRFIPRDTQQAKTERIMAIQPYYKNGLLFFNSDMPPDVKEQLTSQLSEFPKSDHDDILDTLADQFQNEEIFGPLAPSRSEQETLVRARELRFQRAREVNSIYGFQKESDSWKGLG